MKKEYRQVNPYFWIITFVSLDAIVKKNALIIKCVAYFKIPFYANSILWCFYATLSIGEYVQKRLYVFLV